VINLPALSAELMSWLKDDALPLWWTAGADHVRGGLHEALDSNAQPLEANRRARVQARQVYVYATAGQVGWSGPWREAVEHGLDFFLAHYRRADDLYRTVVAPDGSPVDEAAWLYDQAFALLAMAKAAQVLPERKADLLGKAHAIRRVLDGWRWPEGGFREPPARYTHQSNPHMHLFEAMLAWAEVDVDPAWNTLANEIAELAQTRFIDAEGQLHEFFADNWVPADGVDGRIVEPGHQFEWAWLLERWARLQGREDAHQAALRLFEAGKGGVDAKRGVVTQQLLEDGSIHDDVTRLWPQTERIKAAVILGDDEEAGKAVKGLQLYFDSPIPGLWGDKFKPDGAFIEEPSTASSFYHIICAIAEFHARFARS